MFAELISQIYRVAFCDDIAAIDLETLDQPLHSSILCTYVRNAWPDAKEISVRFRGRWIGNLVWHDYKQKWEGPEFINLPF